MSRKRSPEVAIQCTVIQHLQARAVPGVIYFHTPNGGYRGKTEAAQFKAMGVLAGVSDLILFHAGKLYCLELKAQGGRATEEQMAFIQAMERQGAFTAIATGLDRALAQLVEWGLMKPSLTMRGILERLDAAE